MFLNPSGNAGLAQGGSGDVLAGYLGGWLAQPRSRAEVALAIRHAVCAHGLAADALSAHWRAWGLAELLGLLGEAVPPAIPERERP
jgi:NAD(P)H-hydrate epimerase